MLTASSVPFSVAFGLYGQTAYQRIRIPAATPASDTTDQKPGYLCWGTEGTLPTPTPAVGPNFEMQQNEVHTEVARKETLTRIENPDDPSQYIMVNRADWLVFATTNVPPQPWPATNTDTASNPNEEPPKEPEVASYFIPADRKPTIYQNGLKVIFNPPSKNTL